jgi:hypothetical protein
VRRLSARQALTCETAKGKRCMCRCGGLLHGRGLVRELEDAPKLDEHDPHHAQMPRQRRQPADMEQGVLW